MSIRANEYSLSPLRKLSAGWRFILSLQPTFIILGFVPYYSEVITRTPAVILYPPVLLAAWIGGGIAGIVSLLICSLYSLFIFRPHLLQSPASDWPSFIRLNIYLSTCFVFLLLMDRLEKALRKSRNAVEVRDGFISGASHELKTPLTSLKIQLDVAKLKYESPELQELFRKLTKQTTRLDRLISTMLDITLIDSSQFFLMRKKCELSQITSEVVDYLKEKNPTLEFQVYSRAEAFWDVLRIEQVIYYLIQNAIKKAQGNPVKVAVSSEDGKANLTVSYNGVGLTKKEMKNLFVRAPLNDPDHIDSGLGLGLYLSQRIVELHRGEIQIESHPDKGTRFKVILPQIQ